MKKLLIPVVMLLLVLTACSAGEQEVAVPDDLVGTWETEVVDGASHYSMSYTFNADKTYRHTISMPQSEYNPTDYTQDSDGTYKVEADDKLVLLQESDTDEEEEVLTSTYTYSFDGDKLVLSDDSGTYTFDKVEK